MATIKLDPTDTATREIATLPVIAAGVTRFEVIDGTGRILTRWPASIELSLQDNGRTLKVFVS